MFKPIHDIKYTFLLVTVGQYLSPLMAIKTTEIRDNCLKGTVQKQMIPFKQNETPLAVRRLLASLLNGLFRVQPQYLQSVRHLSQISGTQDFNMF